MSGLKGRLAGSLILCVLLFALSGCAHVISREMLSRANQDLTFTQIIRNPETYRGQIAIVGGVIIETENEKNETVITVLQAPLDVSGVPLGDEYSQGRFIARVSGYLDAQVYRKDRLVTLAGEVVGKEVRTVGETEYAYPVFLVKEIHLLKPPLYYSPYYYHYYDPYPYDAYWYWHGGPYPMVLPPPPPPRPFF